MNYLKTVASTRSGFRATFRSGAQTDSHDVACFFMAMDDKRAAPDDLEGYIQIGEQIDPGHDWKEIRRIAETFQPARNEPRRLGRSARGRP